MTTTAAAHQVRFALSQFAVVACSADDPETLADFLNAPKSGTTFELLSLAPTNTGDPASGHLVVLRAELPHWEAAAQAHGVRLVATGAPVRLGPWDGDAVVRADPPHHLLICFPN